MKFSMMTYSMARQGNFGVDDFIRTASELKMEAIDWVSLYDEKPEILKKKSDDAGLAVAAHTFFLSKLVMRQDGWIDDAKQSIADAVVLGAPVVMIPTPGIKGVGDRGESRRIWTDALARIQALAKDAGVILTIENFPGKYSPFVIASDFLEAKRSVPELMLTFDNGNASTGEDQLESLRKTAASVVHVHFKDWERSDSPREKFNEMLDGRFYMPALIGEGVVDSAATIRVLREINYKGYINIEYESGKIPADAAIKRALEFLRGV